MRGITTLKAAENAGHKELAALLKRAGAEREGVSVVRKRWFGLSAAVSSGGEAGVRDLIKRGADVNCAKDNPSGWSQVMYAFLNGKTEIVKLLVGAGAGVDHHDVCGWTSLDHARNTRNCATAQVLEEAGAKPG